MKLYDLQEVSESIAKRSLCDQVNIDIDDLRKELEEADSIYVQADILHHLYITRYLLVQFHSATLCYAMSCYTVLYYTVLCHFIRCRTMLCYDMLYYALPGTFRVHCTYPPCGTWRNAWGEGELRREKEQLVKQDMRSLTQTRL